MKLYMVLCCMAVLTTSVWGRAAPQSGSSSSEEVIIPPGTEIHLNKTNFFVDKRVVFSSSNEIKNLVVMYKGELTDESLGSDEEETALFFNQIQMQPDGSRVNLGQYVLVDNAPAKKILDGKCAATELGKTDVFFGATDGLYAYDKVKREAVRLGDVTEDIVQLQVTNGTGLIYYLAADHRVYTVDLQGKNKQRLYAVSYVKDFVLDRFNNFYYYGEDKVPYVLKVGSSVPVKFSSFDESLKNSYLVRPAIFMDDEVVFVNDGQVYLLASNGTAELSPFVLDAKPTSVNVDIGIIQYYAIDGKIYEYNFVLILLDAMILGQEHFFENLVEKVKIYAK